MTEGKFSNVNKLIIDLDDSWITLLESVMSSCIKDELESPSSPNCSPCNHPSCDHDPESKATKTISLSRDQEIDIDLFIEMGKSYHCKLQRDFRGVSLKSLSDVTPALQRLDEMIGMRQVKTQLPLQMISLLRNKNPEDISHIQILGPPGVGKTSLVHILAEIY